MYNGHVCCLFPYSPSPSPPCFCCHKPGNGQEVRLCSSAGNLVEAGCSRGMQTRSCFLFCLAPPAFAPCSSGEAGGREGRAQRWPLRPGRHHPSWLTPAGMKLARDGPPVASGQGARSCAASLCAGASQQLLPLQEGTGRISPLASFRPASH